MLRQRFRILASVSFCSVALCTGRAVARDGASETVRLPAVKVTAIQPADSTSAPSATPSDNKAASPQPAPALSDDPAECPNGTIPVDKVQDMIRAEAGRQSADVKLALAIAGQESAFGENNNSNKQARGIMQLIPSTAAQYGVKDVCDAQQNIRGGIAFIKDLVAEFGGNVMLEVAAYNAGQKRIYQAKGIPDIRETVNYVAAVTNAYYEFPNALQRSWKGRGAAPVPSAASSDATAQGILPINQLKPSKTAANQWIGGQVLYVGE